MKEETTLELADEIIKVLDYLGGKFGVALDYTQDSILPQVNKLCDKYINWQISTSIIWIIIAVLALIVAVIAAIAINKNSDAYTGGIEWICLGIIAVIMAIIITVQAFDIVEAITFPEKSIYDYIKWCQEWK